MSKPRRICLEILLIIFAIILLAPAALAIQTYDQTVYKVNSVYKEDCCYQQYYIQNNPYYPDNYYSNNYPLNYKLQTKSSYEKIYEQNYERSSYNKKSYVNNKKGFLGTYVKEYTVEIKNRGRTGEYFIITFNLEDKNGFERKESVQNYIKSGETEKFVYRDVQFEKNEILRWEYTINQI